MKPKFPKALPLAAFGVIFVVTLSACSTHHSHTTVQNDNAPDISHGQVQMTLQKGETSKNDVLESFGAPNITTIDGEGREVWTYQRHARVASASAESNYATIILFGHHDSAAGFEESSRTMTLIVKFDGNDRVYDFRSRSSSF